MIIIRILTHRPFQVGRFELVKRTHESIVATTEQVDCDIAVGMNGPSEFSPEEKATWDTTIKSRVIHMDGPSDPGSGRVKLLADVFEDFSYLELYRNDIIVLSDDDMVWSNSSWAQLIAFWNNNPPEDLMILGGYLEPLWDWNIPRGRVDVGGQRAIWRDSAPGCAWTSTVERWRKMLDIGIPTGFGSDYAFCSKLRDLDWRVAQMDLAEHIGWEHSTHGNRSIVDAIPFDKKKWGI